MYVKTVNRLFPNALLHWENLSPGNGRRILEKYRGRTCTFNDDMQGTGAITLAAVLKQLALASGGEAFVPNELSDVVSVCEIIAKDIRSQYTLGYLSSAPTQGGGYHRIKVVVRGTGKAKLHVRTRSGYAGGGR